MKFRKKNNTETTAVATTVVEKRKKNIWSEIWRARYLYLLIAPTIIWLIVFHYKPVYGILLAFKKYSARLGIMGSEWVGLKNFKRIFITPQAVTSIINTLEISFSKLILVFPMAIIIALLITEMRGKRLKRVYQTILTFPHFLSWIVVSAIMLNFFSGNGAINSLLSDLGFEKINFLANKDLFRPLLYITENWKEMGWSSIIYLAAIAGIDPTLYDAAKVDGASRLRQIWHITLPGITGTIATLFILQVGGIMNAGFEQIFTLRNSVVSETAQILDTYIYDITFLSGTPDYGFSTAVGLFKSAINLLLMITANKVTKWLTGTGMFN